jgi:hypothetical protein
VKSLARHEDRRATNEGNLAVEALEHYRKVVADREVGVEGAGRKH